MDANRIINIIVDEIRQLSIDGFSQSDIKAIDRGDPAVPISPGIIVSLMGEVEDESTNETSDIGYQFSVVRIRHKQSVVPSSTSWRKPIFLRFNRVRLGIEGEIITRVKYQEFQGNDGLVITVWIRERHNG